MDNFNKSENKLAKSVPAKISKDSEILKTINENSEIFKMAFKFQEIMMVYESAIKQIETKLEVLNKEYKVTGRRNPIDSVRSRIKSPVSIAEKLEKKGFPVTFQAMTENLSDIAGVVLSVHTFLIFTRRKICFYASRTSL